MCIIVSAADKQELASANVKASTLHSCDDHSCLTVTNRLIVICRKHRQKRNMTLIVLEAILQWLNLVFYVVPNALFRRTFKMPAILNVRRCKCGQLLLLPWLRQLDLLKHCKSPRIELNAMPFCRTCGCCILLASVSSFGKLLSCKGFPDARLCCHVSKS